MKHAWQGILGTLVVVGLCLVFYCAGHGWDSASVGWGVSTLLVAVIFAFTHFWDY